MLTRNELLFVVFYIARGVVEGATRLQKVVFLLQEELGLGGFIYEASRYGPWSKELEDLLQELVRRGEIVVEERSSGQIQERLTKIYRASDHIVKRGRDIFNKLYQSNPILALRLYIKARNYLSLPITYLLAYVYKKYPEYTIQNIIKERVKEWQKFYSLGFRG